ncbi:hypothetical protein [Bradyrhizobium sp. NBAIM01]|uniref:hypothetical protein n=1 Tax=Bradyrhizobium sp. NBAIM01 TaxID=2793818 RepID=UPI001CD2EDF1|nr:hypothetical protein [Bradyrhizobium sp. NBAIM01]MCA1512678.1 hypothetical protein [Bradyrhizobium sp. NBAIM01]
MPEAERRPVSRLQVEIVKELLAGCRRTRWARNLRSPVSSDLKHWAENWGGRDLVARGQGTAYVSTGAAIIAAIELGFVCIPTGEGSHNVFIGVHFDDVAARMEERGWFIARDHVTATRIETPKPEPMVDREWLLKQAAEHGIPLGPHINGDHVKDANAIDEDDPFAVEPLPEPHSFWAQWAKEHGIDGDTEQNEEH